MHLRPARRPSSSHKNLAPGGTIGLESLINLQSVILVHKRDASRLEEHGELEAAVETYFKIVRTLEKAPELLHEALGVFNKIGDLHRKLGNTADAVEAWERAATLYADNGHHESAAALFRKILRTSPEHTPAYLALSKLMIRRGVLVEARQYLLEYSRRALDAGDIDEAFEALQNYADLCPDDAGIRLLLAQGLQRGADAQAAEQRISAGLAFLDLADDQGGATERRLVPDKAPHGNEDNCPPGADQT